MQSLRLACEKWYRISGLHRMPGFLSTMWYTNISIGVSRTQICTNTHEWVLGYLMGSRNTYFYFPIFVVPFPYTKSFVRIRAYPCSLTFHTIPFVYLLFVVSFPYTKSFVCIRAYPCYLTSHTFALIRVIFLRAFVYVVDFA